MKLNGGWGVRPEICLVNETPKCQEEYQSKEAADCYAYYRTMRQRGWIALSRGT